MERGERLAAYLAGDLDASERASLEVEFARDPSLRSDLDRIARVDAVLASMPEVEVPRAVSKRLRAAVKAELKPAKEAWWKQVWVPRLGYAAATASVVAIAVIGGISIFGGSDDPTIAALDAAEGTGLAALPYELTSNQYDESTVLAILDTERVKGLPEITSRAQAEERRDDAVADFESGTAAQYGLTDGTTTGAGATSAGTGSADAGAEPQAPAGEADGFERIEAAPGDVPADITQDMIAACLTPLVEDASPPVVPVYAEGAFFNGTPAIIYVLAVEDPRTEQYDRLEVWVVEPAECAVVHYAVVSEAEPDAG